MYADIVFPFKLPPLTYKVPREHKSDLKGRIVKAPISGRSTFGLVINVSHGSEIKDKKDIKEIEGIYGHFATDSFISFLQWLSDYYIMPSGIALKSSFFEEAIKSINIENSVVQVVDNLEKSNPQIIESSNASLIHNCIKNRNYKSFLYHAHSISDEYSLLTEILSALCHDLQDVIILTPEINEIEKLEPMLRNIVGDRLCIIHSRLSKKKRAEAIIRMMTGQSNVVIGTRSAILAPVKRVSLIVVMNEHSPSYKGEEGLRYNGRDIAVMRGFIEKSCVILSSICPSVESIYNAKIGKYTTLTSSQHSLVSQQMPSQYPRIKIVDSRLMSQKSKSETISRDILKAAKDIALKNRRFLFLVNKKGYSLIRCEDCGYVAECKRCNIPLVFYKTKNTVKCHYCGSEETGYESCHKCKGFNIKPFGAGIERIREELKEALTSDINLLEKDYSVISQDNDITSFIIGMPQAIKKLKDENLDAVAYFNVNGLLSQPDFRAYERAFQEIVRIAQVVRQEGSIYLQTWNPRNKILRFIRNYDFKGFYDYELSQRRMFEYPPYARIILLNIFMKTDTKKFLHDLHKMISDIDISGLKILGPVEIPSTLKSFNHCFQILMKSKDNKFLHLCARQLLNRLEKIRGLKINIDVDPLKI